MRYILPDDPEILPDIPGETHLRKEYIRCYAPDARYFVETGTFKGDTVESMYQLGQFERIYSIEINADLFHDALDRFEHVADRIDLYCEDSVVALEDIIPKLDKQTVFWLDAHASGPLKGGRSGGCPLLDELKLIAASPIKDHVIFIDDKRLFGSAEWDFVKYEDVVKAVMDINPSYIQYDLDGHIRQDVMCFSTAVFP